MAQPRPLFIAVFLLAGAATGLAQTATSQAGPIDAGASPSVGGNPQGSERIAADRASDMDPKNPLHRRGLLVMLYGGFQDGIFGSKVNSFDRGYVWGNQFSLAPRYGLLVGGHLNEDYALAGEFAYATWSYLHDHGFGGPAGEVTTPYRADQFDIDAVLLRTMAWNWVDVVAGPKLGCTFLGRKNDPNVNGPLLGVKAGLFLAPARWVSLGMVADISYLLVVGPHDVVGSLAAGALF